MANLGAAARTPVFVRGGSHHSEVSSSRAGPSGTHAFSNVVVANTGRGENGEHSADDAAPAEQGASAGPNKASSVDTSMASPTDHADAAVQTSEDAESEKTAAERKEELAAFCLSFRSNIGAQALRLLDAHPILISDLLQLEEQAKETTKVLVDDIEKYSPAAYDIKEEPLSLRFRPLLFSFRICQEQCSA